VTSQPVIRWRMLEHRELAILLSLRFLVISGFLLRAHFVQGLKREIGIRLRMGVIRLTMTLPFTRQPHLTKSSLSLFLQDWTKIWCGLVHIGIKPVQAVFITYILHFVFGDILRRLLIKS
jgi:hypothetical protein